MGGQLDALFQGQFHLAGFQVGNDGDAVAALGGGADQGFQLGNGLGVADMDLDAGGGLGHFGVQRTDMLTHQAQLFVLDLGIHFDQQSPALVEQLARGGQDFGKTGDLEHARRIGKLDEGEAVALGRSAFLFGQNGARHLDPALAAVFQMLDHLGAFDHADALHALGIGVQGVGRQVKADGVEFLLQAILLRPVGSVFQLDRRFRRTAEQGNLAGFALFGLGGGQTGQGFHIAEQLAAIGLDTVEGPGPHQIFQLAAVDLPPIHALGEIHRGFIGAIGFPFLHQRLHRRLAHILQGGQGIGDGQGAVRLLDHPEFGAGAVDVGGQQLDAQPIQFLPETVELVGVAHIVGHGGGHEFRRVIGLQPGGLIGHQGIGGGVGLVETVFGELGHLVEHHGGLGAVDAVFLGSVLEHGALLVHFLLDLFPHGPAQQIGTAQTVTGQDLGNLHHLFLINHDAEGFGQDGFQTGMHVIGFFQTVLTGDVAGNLVHGAGTVQSHHGDDVFQAVGLHLADDVAHAGTFQLEHARRIALGQHGVGGGIVQRQRRQIHLCPRHRLDMGHGGGHHRQGFQPQKVELDQSCGFHPLHIELSDRHIGPGIAVQRHQAVQRPVADHHPGGVGRGMAVQAFQLHAGIQQVRDGLFPFLLRLKFRLRFQGFFQGGGLGRIVGHQLADAVHLGIGQAHHPAHIAQHGAGLQLSKGDDLGHMVVTVFALDIANGFFAAVLTKVDIEVGHGDAFGVQEPFEQQTPAQRVQIGNGQGPRHHRPGTGTAARPHRNVVGLGPLDEIGHDQEVAGKAHVLNHAQFEFGALTIRFGHLFTLFRAHIGGEDMLVQAHLQPFAGLDHQGLGLGQILHLVRRQDGLALGHHEGAPLGDHQGVVAGFGQIGEQGPHILGGFEIMLGRQAATVFLGQHHRLGDTQQRIMGIEHIAGGEERFIGGHQRQIHPVGQIDQGRFDAVLDHGAVALQLHIQTSGKGGVQPLQQILGRRVLAFVQQASDGAERAAGQQDQAIGMAGQIVQTDLGDLARVGFQKGLGHQMQQVFIAGLVLAQQHQIIGIGQTSVLGVDAVFAPHRQLHPDDRLNP